MSNVFDSRSGIRERLYLLAVLKDPNDSANWSYNPNHDAWHGASGNTLKVHCEGNCSLAMLAERGINYKTAMEMIGYPEVARG